MRILLVALGIYGSEGGIQRFLRRAIEVLAETDQVTVLSLWDGPEHSTLAPRGVRFIGGRRRKWRTLLSFLWLLLRRPPRLVLYGHVLFAPLMGLARLVHRRAASAVFSYGDDVWDRPPAARACLVRRCVDCVIAISRHTASLMSRLYRIPASRFRLLQPAANEFDGALPRPEIVLAPGPRLLSVTRLDLKHSFGKNVDKVIDALPLILARIPNVHYYIVGDGDQRALLQARARAARVEHCVHMLGWLDDAARDALYSDCHVFVLPSTQEGFGIVYLEAWKHGMPVVAGDAGAAPEVVRHGVDGLCVPPNPQRIAEAVCDLLRDPARARAMGAAGRRRFEQDYTHERFRGNFLRILRELTP